MLNDRNISTSPTEAVTEASGTQEGATTMPSLYRFDQSFEENARLGPRFDGPYPQVPAGTQKSFYGLPVNSRFGIAAGPGINSAWISLYSRLGFDILTYKTVRLHERLAHPEPNFTFIEPNAAISRPDAVAIATTGSSLPLELAPTGGSIGMPSLPVHFWQSDIEVAKRALGRGQVLIVSIVGTLQRGMSASAYEAEFETLARMVVEAGADIVEANLSCPNVGGAEGFVYKDFDLSRRIAAAARRGAGDRPVLLKVGHLGEDLPSFLRAVAGSAQGIVTMNALARRIENRSGTPFFGAARQMAGVHGGAIFQIALDAVQQAMAVIRKERLDLRVIGVGGASTPERAAAFLDAGADAALVASSALLCPMVACTVKVLRPDI